MAYLYRHIRLDSNTPFYIGKGTGRRAWSNKRNSYWKNIVKSVGYKVEIIIDNLTEDQAFIKEIQLIKLYKQFGYCEANISEGGKGGASGVVRSEAHKKIISITHKGKVCKSPMKGIFGKDNHLSRRIRCLETNIIYNSQKEAAQLLNLSQAHISKVCLGQRKTHGGFTFIFEG